jgi:hypothetical protein
VRPPHIIPTPWTPEPEVLDVAQLRAENERLRAEVTRLQRWVTRTDTWPTTAISAAMQVLTAEEVKAGLTREQLSIVERIERDWEAMKREGHLMPETES